MCLWMRSSGDALECTVGHPQQISLSFKWICNLLFARIHPAKTLYNAMAPYQNKHWGSWVTCGGIIDHLSSLIQDTACLYTGGFHPLILMNKSWVKTIPGELSTKQDLEDFYLQQRLLQQKNDALSAIYLLVHGCIFSLFYPVVLFSKTHSAYINIL